MPYILHLITGQAQITRQSHFADEVSQEVQMKSGPKGRSAGVNFGVFMVFGNLDVSVDASPTVSTWWSTVGPGKDIGPVALLPTGGAAHVRSGSSILTNKLFHHSQPHMPAPSSVVYLSDMRSCTQQGCLF
jgi:hypothetical protein